MEGSKNWVAPLMGVLFVVVVVVSFFLLGDGQDATDKTAQEIVDFYTDNSGQQMAGALLVGLASILFLFFAGWIRRVMRDAEGEGGILSAVAFGGGIVFTAGAAVGASLHLALADTADDIDPVAVQAINAIDWDYFLPFAVGMSVFLLASGISIVRHGVLPKWLGWVAIVIGVAAYTPAGFFGFLGGLLWILVVSVIGIVRARGATASA